jgi:hypothetical protein
MNAAFVLALHSVYRLGQTSGVWRESSANQKQRDLAMVLLFSTALILLLLLISRIHSRVGAPRTVSRPWRVFWCLLKHHGLCLSDRLLLCAIVRGQRVRQPAVLLLSPDLFARFARQWLGDSGLVPLWPGAQVRLTRIARQVFGEQAGPFDKMWESVQEQSAFRKP